MSVERMVYHDGFLPPPSKGTRCTAEEGKTRQSDAASADINWIVKKYETTGLLPVEAREGTFMDVSEMPSFQAALNQVRKAEEYFMTLPPDVRAVFENQPARLLDAWNAGEYPEVFKRIGLLEELPAAEPAVVQPVAGAKEPV